MTGLKLLRLAASLCKYTISGIGLYVLVFWFIKIREVMK